MAIPLSQLWLHGEMEHRLPAEWPLYDIFKVGVGDIIGPMFYEVDQKIVDDYSRVMGVSRCLYPTVPGRHTDPLRNSHVDTALNSRTINARMMMELHRPPQVGDLLTLQGAVMAVYERRNKPYVTIQSETRNQDGELIDRLRKTMLLSRKDVAQKWNFIKAR
jgi:hypothetical protein